MSSSFFHRSRSPRLLFAALITVALIGASPVYAFADGHVALNSDTDTCAECHRSHSSASSTTFRESADPSKTRMALTVGDASVDKNLCFTCHGSSAEGSQHDVQSEFDKPSQHVLAPLSSAFGPKQKQCSDCHDSHGTDKTSGGGAYPALLRSENETRTLFFSGDGYCGTCHPARPASRFSGVPVYEQTAHFSQMTTPTSGTDVRCSICHAPHGSTNSALVVEQLTPPAVPATVTVPANDRRFCIACHAGPRGSYPGAAAYAGSAHGSSAASVAVSAEYASKETTRLVGECQVCHDPMGRDDGTGKPLRRLLDAAEPTLCYRCHRAGGAASTDLQSIAYTPLEGSNGDIVAAYSPPVMATSYGRVAVYAQDAGSGSPRPLVGPREYKTGQTVGKIAAGDINGDGRDEVISTVPGAARLTVLEQDGSRGLAPGPALDIAGPASAIAVGNIFPTADTQRPVIAVATGTTGGLLYLYRLDDQGALAQIGAPISIGDGPFSIAAGDVRGDNAPEFVVSAHGSDQIVIVGDSATSDVPSVTGPFATPAGPVAVAVGQVWPGRSDGQIAVAAEGSGGMLAILSGDGTTLGSYSTSGYPGTVQDVAVGDVLPGFDGSEVVVAVGAPDSGGLLVFPQSASGGLAAARAYAVPAHYSPGRLAIGDVNGDGKAELVVGNAGQPASAASPCSPSIQTYQATSDGMDLATARTYVGGGTELAGSPPEVLVAPLPAVGPSRHPVDDASAASHVSTEAAPFPRHVTCSDCHDSHQATDATTAAAPAVTGAMTGALGVTVSNSAAGVTMSGPQPAKSEYEVCLKCHSAFPAALDGRRDVALDFDTLNSSVHGVEDAPTGSSAAAGTFVPRAEGLPAWTNQSIMRCTDCHGDADGSAPSGPHISSAAPILKSPYLGVAPSDESGFCYRCHQYDVYYSGTADSAAQGSQSNFYSSAPALPALHAQHTRTYGLGCEACHVSHGAQKQPHLLRDDIGFVDQGSGGTCTNACHASPETYAR